MNIQQLKDQMAAAREAMKTHGQTALKTAFAEFFDACPEIKAIVWTQYTPYFNDGESCEFGVNDPEFKAFGQMDEDEDEDDFGYQYGDSCYLSNLEFKRDGRTWRKPPIPPQTLTEREAAIVKAAREIKSIFSEDDLFETVFGDHVIVRATRAGFEIEEYSHD